jgi:L-ascorbate metabolism protein UlaG (beta-lactamase superfamily)
LTYPVSDHFDGTLFFNPEGVVREPPEGVVSRPSGRFPLLRWVTRREGRAKWPDHVKNQAYPPPAGPVAAGDLAVTFIGHASFMLRLDGLTLLTDPVFSRRCSPVSFAGPSRVRAPGQPMAALPKPDAILLSHNHYDHCDIPALRDLRWRFGELPIFAPLGNKKWLESKGLGPVTELDWWQSTQFHDATITLTPARHFAARTLRDRNMTLWGGFFLDYRGAKVYFAGDSGYTSFFTTIRDRLGAPDFALLPIGAYEPRWFMGSVHMNPADAVKAFHDLNAGQAVGMHFGTFQLTDEAIDAPLIDLAAARDAAGLAAERFTTLDCGETRQFRLKRD